MGKKIFRYTVSWICIIIMVATVMTDFKYVNVIADTVTTTIATGTEDRTALLAEIGNEQYNFALNKTASVSKLTTVDGGTNLSAITDGKFSTANNASTIIEIARGTQESAWVQVDLGKAYDTGKIDRVAVQYKTNNSGPKSGYSIQYSLNGMDFVEVATVGAIAGANNMIYLDKITLTSEQAEAIPYAKYVRVVSNTNTSAYGMQVKGMAVLTDGTTTVEQVGYQEVETLDNPVSLTVTSSDYEQLEYSFEAALGDQGDYTYYAYIDEVQKEETVKPGVTYTEKGLKGGNHEVKIVSFKDGVVSEGLVQSVDVKDVKDLLTDDRNIAFNKSVKSSSIREEDIVSYVTDGNLTNLFRTATTDTQADIVIDLGQNYRLDAIERTVSLYSTAAARYPKNYTIDYSLNGTDFETVATAEGTSELQTAVIDFSGCTLPAVKYVRFHLSNPVSAGYGFQIHELGVIVKEGADLTPVEVKKVNDPADFNVEITDYNTARVTITAGENQENYKYNIYVDNEIVLKEVEAGTYELKDIPAGNKEFTVKSVLDGITSEGITVTKEVKDAFLYTHESLANSNVEAGKTLEEKKTVEDKTYYNYCLYKNVKASALSEENETLNAAKAIDGDSKTRWASMPGVDPQWYVIDLKHLYKIDELDIVWQNSSAKDFDIEVSEDGAIYKKLGMVKSGETGSRYDNIKFIEEITARYIRINGTARTGQYGYSMWELGIYGPEEAKTVYYNVSVDGEEEQVAEEDTYRLPTEAQYGYYCEGKMYKPGAEVTVNAAMKFTSVKELSVSMAEGAGIKTSVPAGLRFQATVASDNEAALADQNVIKEGTLITANDIYENKGSDLTLSSAYTYLTVENTGWYNGQTGTYCGAIAQIAESNYIRDFVARAYVTVEYEDGTETTVYSDMSSVRSIKYVAEKVAQAGYPGLGDEEKGIINGFAAAK